MNVVDSSGWIEFLNGGGNGIAFEPPIRDTAALIVPAIAIYEVYKRFHQVRGADVAIRTVAVMRLGHVVDVDAMLAIEAADLSLAHKLPMADSIILATARHYNATLWTQDADFEGLPGVRYIPASKS